jgi:hypothetical protein
VRRGFKADTAGEFAELVAADDELSRLSVYMAEASLRGDDAVEPTRLYRAVDETALTSW